MMKSSHPDDLLPDTGVDPVWERMLSPCFIKSPAYGTRNSAALVLHRCGQLDWFEQLYDADNSLEPPIHQILNLPAGWLAGENETDNTLLRRLSAQ